MVTHLDYVFHDTSSANMIRAYNSWQAGSLTQISSRTKIRQ